MHSYQGLITKEKPFVYYGYTELLQKSSSSITQTPGAIPGIQGVRVSETAR